MNFKKDLLIISEEVQIALKNNKPIVALESTIITHGMDFPKNYETALQVEKAVRDNGSIPATIAILDGKLRVGLSEEDIIEMSKNKNFIKCSTRDIPYALLKKLNGSTTVAATMYIAHLAGIKLFVTGGIGGVHYCDDMDISADLIELSRTPVTVISAGIKSILDIPRTLEFLETYCVPVIGYKTNKFPEFFFTEGDCDSKIRLDSEKECADFINLTHNIMDMKNGILIACPVPEELQADKDLVKNAIKQALLKAKNENVKGSAVTPMLLREINNITEGKSCESNVALILNNAAIGSRIAYELSKN
jgi:pseudouridine-5'-phosphate glycosidase